MRVLDYNVLTMNEVTNTKDPRISAIHVPGSNRSFIEMENKPSSPVIMDKQKSQCC